MGLFFYNPSETSTPPARIHCCSIQAGETKVFESKASQLSRMQMVAPAPRGTMAETPPMPMPLAETATHFARFLHENRRREAMPANLPGKHRRRRGKRLVTGEQKTHVRMRDTRWPEKHAKPHAGRFTSAIFVLFERIWRQRSLVRPPSEREACLPVCGK